MYHLEACKLYLIDCECILEPLAVNDKKKAFFGEVERLIQNVQELGMISKVCRGFQFYHHQTYGIDTEPLVSVVNKVRMSKSIIMITRAD